MKLNRRNFVLGAGSSGWVSTTMSQLPQVTIGKHSFSRLIVGGNPISGNSHLSENASREMENYFTAENTKRLLRNCEAAGINTWLARGDKHIVRLLNEYRLEGGRIQWIAQTASELASIPGNIRNIAAAGAVGIYHHGTQTDRHWKQGKIDETREMLKAMRQAGVLVGLATHIPEVIDYAESKGWDLDYYMTCLYNLSRSDEEASRLAGRTVKDEFFWDPDREQMLRRVKQTSKPCLIFKVYGSGRKCSSPGDMLAALRLTFQYAKPSDAVVIGMFPKRSEQVIENCDLLKQAIAAAAVS